VDRVIPCPKPGCKGDFKLSDLEAYLVEGDDSVRCHGCRAKHSIASLLFGIHPAGSALALEGLLHEMKEENRALHQELLSFLQREFTELFHREQSLGESHCPAVFTLEFERLPKILPTQLEAWWRALTDKPEPAIFTLYCEQPGAWHSVKSYRIEQPGRRLTALAPHLEKLVALFKVAGPLIGLTPAKPTIDTMRGLADLGAKQWGSGPKEISRLEEFRWEHHADRLTLFTLRRLLDEIAPNEKNNWGGLTKVLTKQFHYLWLCEQHAKPHFAEWASA
jgi:hypothetical protein